MGKIYTDQDKLVLYIYTGIDLSIVGSVQIQGTDPSGSSITPLVASIENASKGIVVYEVPEGSSPFTSSGIYTLWVKINYLGGREANGEPFKLQIRTIGT